MRVWPPEWGTLMYNYTSECRSRPIVLANCWVSECMLGVRQTVSWLQMPATLLWDEAVQNATEILTLKCSTQKNKAETTLQNHEKTPNIDKDALENDDVGNVLEHHHNDQ